MAALSRLSLLAAVAISLADVVANADEPSRPASTAAPAHRRYAVAAVGDSLTDPRSGGGGYVAYLRGRCPGSRFDTFGKGGEMVNQMRSRFAREVLDADPAYSHVIVFGGVNDLYSDLTAGRTPAKIQADLSSMYEAAHQRGIAIVAITVAPWGGFSRYYNARRGASTLELNRWIMAQARAGAVDRVVDAYGLLSCGDPTRICGTLARKDRLHLNASGHEKLGAALHAQVFSDCE